MHHLQMQSWMMLLKTSTEIFPCVETNRCKGIWCHVATGFNSKELEKLKEGLILLVVLCGVCVLSIAEGIKYLHPLPCGTLMATTS
jgi:hypothetical protein